MWRVVLSPPSASERLPGHCSPIGDPSGWTVASVSLAISGPILSIVFVMLEKKREDRAIMPLGLFASRSFMGLTLLTLFLYGALGGLLVLLPYALIEAAGYSGTAAGAALLPLPVVLSLASPVMGGIAERIGARLPLTIGPLVVGLGSCWPCASTQASATGPASCPRSCS